MPDFCFAEISLGLGEAGGLGRGHCHSSELTLRNLWTPRGDDQQGVRARSLVLRWTSHLEAQSKGGHHVNGCGLGRLRGKESPPESEDPQPAISGAGRTRGAYKSSGGKEMSEPRGHLSRAKSRLSWKLSQ